MRSGRTVLAVMLSASLAGCAAGAAPTPGSSSIGSGDDGATQVASPTVGADPAGLGDGDEGPAAMGTATAAEFEVLPPPTGVTFDERLREASDGTYRITQAVTWSPSDERVEIVVYGVTHCVEEPAEASPGARGPCVVGPVDLPETALVPLAAAPAKKGHVEWSWVDPGCDIGLPNDPAGPPYVAVVVAAYGVSDGVAGRSRFVIAEPGGWSVPEPGTVVQPC